MLKAARPSWKKESPFSRVASSEEEDDEEVVRTHGARLCDLGGRAGRVSQPLGHHRGALSARRTDRSRRAHHTAAHAGGTRSAGGGGEPLGLRRQLLPGWVTAGQS